jgi:large subunit ribosomal protein L9
MKVLLIQDVDNLGYAGDVKKVANGYGRNYLLPQQLAVLATPGALKQAETIRKAAEKRRAQETADAQAVANQLTGLKLLFERRAGETGKLYGSVTSGDIAEAIHEKTGIELDKRKVAVPEPIRSLGEQEVPIKLMIDVTTSITVEVVPLGGILERERLEEVEAEVAEAETEAEEAIDDVVAAAAEVAESPVEEEDEEPVLESEPEAEEEEEETEA